ncbi:response regulator [Azohydromonas australica]|uniref:response regulator n=1 Tax=Azohydromonas australica TaxID=364039 RepID=UPI000426D4AD|nr:response regulator transcription factor [Azohydromonas australica]
MDSIRVLVADDHPPITRSLQQDLKMFGIDEVQATTDGTAVLSMYTALKPDVLVLDLRIGAIRGLDVARQVLAMDRNARIVFYSQFDQPHIVREAYRLGGKAFLPKSAPLEIVAEAITAAKAGNTYLHPEIAKQIALLTVRGEESPADKLDERELKVFKLMAKGLTNEEIAVELNLHPKTIGIITKAVRESLGVQRPADITRLALKYELIDD